MKTTVRALALCLPFVLALLTSGCAAGPHATASRPTSVAAAEPLYLAQVTCWDSMSCCIQRFPLSAAESCGASAVEIAEVLNGAKLLYDTTHPEQVSLKEEEHTSGDSKDSEASESEGEAAPEPPDCQGQDHHVISRRIARALQQHENLKGLYKPRDKRFVAQAKDEESHCGYQTWHREVDSEVIEWIEGHERATREQFEALLHKIYSRKEMLERFPHGF